MHMVEHLLVAPILNSLLNAFTSGETLQNVDTPSLETWSQMWSTNSCVNEAKQIKWDLCPSVCCLSACWEASITHL